MTDDTERFHPSALRLDAAVTLLALQAHADGAEYSHVVSALLVALARIVENSTDPDNGAKAALDHFGLARKKVRQEGDRLSGFCPHCALLDLARAMKAAGASSPERAASWLGAALVDILAEACAGNQEEMVGLVEKAVFSIVARALSRGGAACGDDIGGVAGHG